MNLSPLDAVTQEFLRQNELRVLDGPFTGMAYVSNAAGSALLPKLIGSYEQELHAALRELLKQAYSAVINIGCGEGYYAVGLAQAFPQVPIFALDPDPNARRLCTELALLNQVSEQVTIMDQVGTKHLAAFVAPGSLVICDCEGCEHDLLHPEAIPGLQTSTVLVELHDHVNPLISSDLANRFSATHELTWIEAQDRDPNTYPCLASLDEVSRHIALSEHRPPGMRWLLCTPKAKAKNSRRTKSLKREQSGKNQSLIPPLTTPVKITACILARNEAQRIEAALQSLQGWTDEILVIDNESEDETVTIAQRYTDRIFHAPRADNFDAARNLAIEHGTGDWIFYLDADERMPPALGPLLRKLIEERGSEFEAVSIPFRHFFCGKWIEHCGWWPGYTRPQLLKKGAFRYNERLHLGVSVEGRTFVFPADDPEMAIVHLSYDDIRHWLTKMNNYTDGEAANLDADMQSHSWQAMLAHFVQDWQLYYERGRADLDGMHGFVLSFFAGFYRFASRAKLWDRRRKEGLVLPNEAVPTSLREMLELMAKVSQEGATRWLTPNNQDALLVQCACGDQTRLLDLTRARHEDYARAHQMDYVCRYEPQQTGRSPMWDKIPLLIEVLRQGKYQYVFWIDADTLLVDRERDLREALPPHAWLGMAQHGNPRYFNNGVMLMRNTPQALAFLEEVWNNWPVNSGWEDNEAVLQVLRRNPERWQGVVPLGDEWNSTALQNEHPHPVIKAWHGFGQTPDRYAAMLQALQEIVVREQRADVALGNRAGAEVGTTVPHPFRPVPNLVPLDPVRNVDLSLSLGRPLRVRWEGDQRVLSSLALVNRELCLGLLRGDDIELSLKTLPSSWETLTPKDDSRFTTLFDRIHAPLSGDADITIRHFYPPNWQRPAVGKLIVMQPWEYSHLPREWITGATHQADEIWVYSRYVRDIYVRSGIPAEKVQVIPAGVRTDVYTPKGKRYPLKTKKKLRFLFVGGTIFRKGADLLLQAYVNAFRPEDDVCLVVKDMGTQTFYRGGTYADAFRQAQADPNVPEVIYLEDDMTETQMASLYRACNCVVLPYRGEGFGLPPLEGMACGIPAIVTAGGSTDDYLDDTMALRVPHHKRVLERSEIGFQDCVGDPWVLEPDLNALIAAFRWVQEHPEETKRRGQAAREHVLQGWSWERANAMMRDRLEQVITLHQEKALPQVKVWQNPPESKAVRKATASKKKIELSLCMIVRNEEARLAHCLKSIAPYVDEMIVVDTGSTDKTREIASECGARVFDFPWTESFADARNKSIEQATGQWIFWMDADDVISPECGKQLTELIRPHPDRDAAFQVQVKIPPGPGEFSSSAVDHVKLFPNLPTVRFEHRIHEQVLPALRRAKITIEPSEVYVTHAHYDRSPAGQAQKRQRDFRLLYLDLQDNPNHPFVLFNLGMTHLYATREHEIAAHYLRRSIDNSDWRDSIVRKAYALLTTAYLGLQDWKRAIQANEQGRSYYPDDAELLYLAGQIYPEFGRFAEAKQALERLTQGQDEPHYRSVDIGLRTYRGQHELARLAGYVGDWQESERRLQDVIAAWPTYFPAHFDLIRTLLTQGKKAEAKEALIAIPQEQRSGEEYQHLQMLVV